MISLFLTFTLFSLRTFSGILFLSAQGSITSHVQGIEIFLSKITMDRSWSFQFISFPLFVISEVWNHSGPRIPQKKSSSVVFRTAPNCLSHPGFAFFPLFLIFSISFLSVNVPGLEVKEEFEAGKGDLFHFFPVH